GGTFATAIINSSSAFIAIVQKIYAGGGIDLTVVVALVLGSNIGTTITAYLSSIGGTISAKRAALFHTLFNLAGAVIVMIFLGPYTKLVTVVGQSIGATSELQVAIAHLFFNLIFAIAVIPVLPYFMTLLEKLIPGADKQLPRTKLVELNDDIVHSFPEGAMSIAKQGIVQMGDLVLDSIINSQHFLNTEDANEAVMVHEMEETINIIDTQLTTYLLKIVKASPSEYIAEGYTQYLETIKNYERISDLTTNLADFYALIFENKEKLSPDALEDLNTMYTLLIDIIKRSNNIFKTEDTTQLKALFKDESYLDIIEGKYREKHFQRMAQGICTTKITASIYVDILSTLERMGDHGVNVARFVDSPIKQHSYKKIV
ncbi:MAG: Na/Pi cotransporter family protein, partial [Erysipelothrix sp.]|nr:Na/Pi cotransporter family protein [Erysipelothrix sp.]